MDLQQLCDDRPEGIAGMGVILVGGQRGRARHAAENQNFRMIACNGCKTIEGCHAESEQTIADYRRNNAGWD